MFTMSGAAITWSSKMQPIVALSTTEAEYISLSHAAQEAIYLGNFFEELRFPEYKTITMYEDNMGALQLVSNKIYPARTKHIGVRFHFLRDLVQDNKIILQHVSTVNQLAHVLTKFLPLPRFQFLRSVI
ncbi:unnamed protein product, partial [Discosporangium mesarthrocarpum]